MQASSGVSQAQQTNIGQSTGQEGPGACFGAGSQMPSVPSFGSQMFPNSGGFQFGMPQVNVVPGSMGLNPSSPAGLNPSSVGWVPRTCGAQSSGSVPMYDPQHSVLSQISQLVGNLDANQMRTLHQVLGEQIGHQGRMIPEFFGAMPRDSGIGGQFGNPSAVLPGGHGTRGDAVKDQVDGLGAIFQDLSASAPSSIAGLNTVITYSMMPGNHCTTSDCIRAHIQSPLKTKHRAFVLLPPELVPPSKKHLKSPCAQLHKSLYGHPESSAHWQSHWSAVLQKQLGGVEFQNLPSVFWFDSMKLILSVYVDDLTLAGEASKHEGVWKTLKQHINLDPPTEFGRVLGRDHRLVKFEGSRALALECSDFACQCVSLYEELSGVKAKPFRTPNCDEGSLIASNDETRGQLSGVAARLVMKLMWLCRIGRPDVMTGVVQCAKHVTCWSLNDDKRVQRIVGYLKSTSDYAHVIKINDSPSDLSLSLYCDADFGGDIKDMKSTSGFVLAIEGADSFALLGWGSKKQKVVSRSTTESEFVSLSSALFQEALPMLEVWQHLLPAINLVIHEDNTARIAIIAKGYIPQS